MQNRALRIIFYLEKNTKKIHKLADINNISEFNETIITNFTHKQDSIPNKNNLINEIDQYTIYERLRLGAKKAENIEINLFTYQIEQDLKGLYNGTYEQKNKQE